jgi:very-short-patch-repair endonuclease
MGRNLGEARVRGDSLETATAQVADVVKRIQNARRELLDLSARNRLISTPRGTSQGRRIEIDDERSEEVFRLLVRERKVMSFLPGSGEVEDNPVDEETTVRLMQPEEVDAGGAPDARHTDLRLQTRLTSDRLQARLLAMYYDAQTFEQEQGVSILYLAMGFLKWYESASSDKPRYAPLLLIPVDLDRPSAARQFTLRYREEDVTTNLSLQAKLTSEFGIDLPDVPETEEIAPDAYFVAVAHAVADQPRWEVLRNDMVIWFFSFAKYLMYRDLDPGTWPAHSPLGDNPTLSSLLGEGFASEPALCGENDKIDPLIPPSAMTHITDADSSQAVVIEEVRRGRHLVVQGPPGTGKSQTITNLIATAVKEGKKVLFVAEKMAALEVVHRRLEQLKLGAICLELHSNKANKKSVLEELARTLALGRPRTQGSEERIEALRASIERLNAHSAVMNTPGEPSGLTPYQVIGRLAGLYGRGVEPLNLKLAGMESWTGKQFRDRCKDVEELQAHLQTLGAPANHAWRGVNRTEPILHAESREFREKLEEAIASLSEIVDVAARLANTLGLPALCELRLTDVRQLAQFSLLLVRAPTMDRLSVGDRVWEDRTHEIARFVEHGRTMAETRYRDQYRQIENLRNCLARIGAPDEHPCRGIKRFGQFSREALSALSAVVIESIEALETILDASKQLELSLELDSFHDASFKEIQQREQLALRVTKAPRMDRAQIGHSIWASGRDQIAGIVNQGQAHAATRAELDGRIAEVGWQTDLSLVRLHLAGHGRSFFRWFNRDYREAVATLKGILKGEAPRGLSERLKLVDAVISTQATSKSLDEDPLLTQMGRDAFGTEWRGTKSDWGLLAEIVAWDEESQAAGFAQLHRSVLATSKEQDSCRAHLNILSAHLPPLFDRLKFVFESLDLDYRQAFGVDAFLSVSVRALIDRLKKWRERPEALIDWIEYQASRRLLDRTGMGSTASAIIEGRNTAEAALSELQSRFHHDLIQGVAVPRAGLRRREDTVVEQKGTGSVALDDLGRAAFGTEWKGILSDWSNLEAIGNWDRECREAHLPWNHRHHMSRLDSIDEVRTHLRNLAGHFNPMPDRLKTLFKMLEFDTVETFGRDSQSRILIRDLLSVFRRWQDEHEGLSKWIGYRMRRTRLSAYGLAPLLDGLHESRISISAAVDQLRVSYYQVLIRDVFRRHPALAEFDGQSFEQWIKDFQALDQARIEMARAEVATAHYDAIPRSSAGGEMAIVRREIEKKRNHKPIRQLLKEAGTAILSIKPVFMMSPISIAQYLEPGSVTFDLLLIDEASQVSPVDALGAMTRARQVVVVGDDRQLPPSRFFNKLMDQGDLPSDPDDDMNAGDLESILGLCVAQGMSRRMLRWHYRSRHHSLIAVSNREFYDNYLYVVPSPTTITAMHGLHFRFVKDGIFDRGNSATNRAEAKVIAEAVIEHAKRNPKKSLGVGAFSVAQRDAIRDELEALQRQHVELVGFFSKGGSEPFFVKNLENIQGDERDVIFISVGYAKDASGYMAMNFGPLSSQGGERRLNVLISRARERCEVFSSITADDIDLERAKSRGAAAFKTFLRYAATGVLDTQAPTGGDYDSDFERQVARALEGLGYDVHCQVGTAGFIIDLAVVDPDQPGRYLLGIECDGATYHSSRSARDRDRLRETVLRDRGWRIHRIWSTDWFHRQGEQLQKVVGAIDKARLEMEGDEESETSNDNDSARISIPETDIERAEPAQGLNGEASAPWVSPYVEAVLDVPSATPIHETRLSVLAGIVATVVEIEGPIHREEVAKRITSLWGQARMGNRIAEAVFRAIETSVNSGVIRADLEFLTHSQRATDPVPVRCRSTVASQNLKRPEMIPQVELRRAILCLVEEHVGLRRDEIPTMVVRVLGFKATGAKLREVVEMALGCMVEENQLTLRDEKVFLP